MHEATLVLIKTGQDKRRQDKTWQDERNDKTRQANPENINIRQGRHGKTKGRRQDKRQNKTRGTRQHSYSTHKDITRQGKR